MKSSGCRLTCNLWNLIRPVDCPQRSNEGRGKNLFFMAKNSNGEFCFDFELFIEILFIKVGFFPIV